MNIFRSPKGNPDSYYSSQPRKSKASTFIVGAIALGAVALGAVSGGVGGVLIMLSAFAALTGLYVLVTGRRSWARLAGGRKVGAIVLAGSLVLFVVGGVMLPPPSPEAIAARAAAESAKRSAEEATRAAAASPSSSASPSSVPSPTPTPTKATESASPQPTVSSPTEATVVNPEPAPPAHYVAPAPSVPPAPVYVPPAPVNAPPAPVYVAPAPATVFYASCKEVRAAGAAPIYAGQPGYSSKLDRDGDGVACEK